MWYDRADMKLSALFLVGVGGFFGAIARFAVATFAAHRWGDSFPWGTFIINITGCFMIATFLTIAAGFHLHEGWRYVFPIGFVGAYTTFSTYEYETMRLIDAGAWPRAVAYVLSSTIVGLAAVYFGAWIVRRFS